ncbi:MAG TPA: hypothetical protein VF974_07750 [Patescibacteria group bacterium]
MFKKLFVSLLIGTVIFLACFCFAISAFTIKPEEEFYKKLSWVRSNVLQITPDAGNIMLINTSTDLQLFQNDQVSSVVANRRDLIRLFNHIIASGDTTCSIALDLDLSDPLLFGKGERDSLQAAINKLPFICVPLVRKPTGIIPPVIHARYAWASYDTYGEKIDKIELMRKDTAVPSLPLAMLTKNDSTRYRLWHGILLKGRQPYFNFIWPGYFIKDCESAQKAGAECEDLAELLSYLQGNPDSIKSYFHQKNIFIGNFSQINATPAEEMSGVFVLANTYLTIASGQHIIRFSWVLLMIVVFTVLSYYSWYESLPTVTLPKWLIFSKEILEWLNKLISYTVVLLLLSAVSILVFGISVEFIVAAPIFSFINYFRFKKYKENQ